MLFSCAILMFIMRVCGVLLSYKTWVAVVFAILFGLRWMQIGFMGHDSGIIMSKLT